MITPTITTGTIKVGGEEKTAEDLAEMGINQDPDKIIEITKDEEWNINFELELINVGVAAKQASELINAVQSLTVSVPDHIKADGKNAEASYRRAIANGIKGEDLDAFINSPRFDAGIQIMNTYDALAEKYGNNIPEKYINETLNDLETLMFDPNVIIQTGCASGPDLGLCDTMDKRQAMELTIKKYLNGELTGEQKTIIESNIGLYMKCLAQLSVEGASGLGLNPDADVMKDLDKKLDQWGSSWMSLAKDVSAGKNSLGKQLSELGIPYIGDDSVEGFSAGLLDAAPEMVEGAKFVADLAMNKDGIRDELYQMIKDDPTGVLSEMVNGLVKSNSLMASAVGEHEEARFWDGYGAGILFGEALTGAALAKAVKAIKAAKKINTINVRDSLLNNAQNQKLRNAVNEIYRPGGKIGDGGLADAIRHEKVTGQLVGGKSHVQKGMERVKNLENIINKQQLSSKDLKIANDLLNDLKDALNLKGS